MVDDSKVMQVVKRWAQEKEIFACQKLLKEEASNIDSSSPNSIQLLVSGKSPSTCTTPVKGTAAVNKSSESGKREASSVAPSVCKKQKLEGSIESSQSEHFTPLETQAFITCDASLPDEHCAATVQAMLCAVSEYSELNYSEKNDCQSEVSIASLYGHYSTAVQTDSILLCNTSQDVKSRSSVPSVGEVTESSDTDVNRTDDESSQIAEDSEATEAKQKAAKKILSLANTLLDSWSNLKVIKIFQHS